MVEVIKISDNLYIDAEDFYRKVCEQRGVKTYSEDPNVE
jgi:hypothetical protein